MLQGASDFPLIFWYNMLHGIELLSITVQHYTTCCIVYGVLHVYFTLYLLYLVPLAGKPKKENALKTICLMLGPDFITDHITVGQVLLLYTK